jgi:hypothetical protein
MIKVDCYNFLFHPLHETHSFETKTLAIITNIALTAITLGTYLLAFGAMHCMEKWNVSHTPQASVHSAEDQLGKTADRLKTKLIHHLGRLEALANSGEWRHIQAHTSHIDSAFDWWMFPSDKRSRGQGDLYKLSPDDILHLKRDPEFMNAYRRGVCLVAKSWGWDLENNRNVTTAAQRWTHYTIRLEKMLYSLHLFGQDDLRRTLSQFITQQRIALEPWALTACS